MPQHNNLIRTEELLSCFGPPTGLAHAGLLPCLLHPEIGKLKTIIVLSIFAHITLKYKF